MSDGSKRARISLPQLDPSCIWARGPFALDKIAVTVLDGTRVYSEEVTKAANEHWEGTVIKEKPNLFDGPIWSLVNHEVQTAMISGQEGGLDSKKLHLSMQLSSYKFNIFTHFVGKGTVPRPSRCNGLGVMSLTETSDGYFVFGLRSRKAGAMPWHWHCVPAGVLDAPDPHAVLDKELHEETGYDWTTVRRGDVLALISAGEEQGHKPELLCRMSLSASAADVHDKHRAAEDSAEHEALIFVKTSCQSYGSDACSGTVGKPEGSSDMEAIIVEAGTSPMFTDFENFLCGDQGIPPLRSADPKLVTSTAGHFFESIKNRLVVPLVMAAQRFTAEIPAGDRVSQFLPWATVSTGSGFEWNVVVLGGLTVDIKVSARVRAVSPDQGPITDLARTALLLLQDSVSPEILPLPETYHSTL